MSYARACVVVSIFFMLVGTAYGAAQLARNSVKARHLAAGSVTSAKVRDGSLARRDLSAGLLAEYARRGPQGAQGEPGAPGPAGQAGARGPVGNEGFGVMYRWVESTGSGGTAGGPCCQFFGVSKDGTGRYEVNLYESLDDCGFSATIAQYRHLPGTASIPGGTIAMHRTTFNNSVIRVATYGPDGMPADRDFLLTVFC